MMSKHEKFILPLSGGFTRNHLKYITIYPILNGLARGLVLGVSFLSKALN